MSIDPTVVTKKTSYVSIWGDSSGLTASSLPFGDLAFPLYNHFEKIIYGNNETRMLGSADLEPISLISDSESKLTDDLRKILFIKDNQGLDISITNQTSNLIAKLEKNYELLNSSEIINYLLGRHDFISTLENIPKFLLNYFKKGDSLALELMDDPEDLGVEFLSVIVIVGEDNENALESLEKFQREWLFDNKEITKYNICFDVEYE